MCCCNFNNLFDSIQIVKMNQVANDHCNSKLQLKPSCKHIFFHNELRPYKACDDANFSCI